MNEIRYWLHAITPLHVGAGRGLGYIDMPITREKVTDWPYIPGSSVKGVIADLFKASSDNDRKEDQYKKAAFGLSGSDNDSAAGALVFTDANILCLPIKSFYGTFAWVTSPFCLKRFDDTINIPDFQDKKGAFVTNDSVLAKEEKKIYLEDLDLNASAIPEAGNTAGKIAQVLFKDNAKWQKFFIQRFVIVDDDLFTFLCESGTDVSAHIRINSETGIVQEGALWYEETLPVESILTGKIWCDKVFGEDIKDIKAKDLIEHFCKNELDFQIGGKASTGKGQVHCVFETLKAGD